MEDMKNFYDSIREARARLDGTVVTYDGEPMQVFNITDGHEDGIFRVYMSPLNKAGNVFFPDEYFQYQGGPQLDAFMTKWLATDRGVKSGIKRKHINSPAFNKFRPFPLGMCNYAGRAYYLERMPQRRTHQGLSAQGYTTVQASLDENAQPGRASVPMNCEQMADCIKGKYPSLEECVKNMNDPECTVSSVAFNRHFAIVKGPLRFLFLVYKENVIGLIEEKKLILAKKYKHYREVCEELQHFSTITYKE